MSNETGLVTKLKIALALLAVFVACPVAALLWSSAAKDSGAAVSQGATATPSWLEPTGSGLPTSVLSNVPPPTGIPTIVYDYENIWPPEPGGAGDSPHPDNANMPWGPDVPAVPGYPPQPGSLPTPTVYPGTAGPSVTPALTAMPGATGTTAPGAPSTTTPSASGPSATPLPSGSTSTPVPASPGAPSPTAPVNQPQATATAGSGQPGNPTATSPATSPGGPAPTQGPGGPGNPTATSPASGPGGPAPTQGPGRPAATPTRRPPFPTPNTPPNIPTWTPPPRTPWPTSSPGPGGPTPNPATPVPTVTPAAPGATPTLGDTIVLATPQPTAPTPIPGWEKTNEGTGFFGKYNPFKIFTRSKTSCSVKVNGQMAPIDCSQADIPPNLTDPDTGWDGGSDDGSGPGDPGISDGSDTDIPSGSYHEERVKISWYWPPLGGTNCGVWQNGQCVSRMASGARWQDWVGRAIACPPQWKFGTKVVLPNGSVWTCMDRGGAIHYNGGITWIDLLTNHTPYPFGTVVKVRIYSK